jgi:hypothetical protein
MRVEAPPIAAGISQDRTVWLSGEFITLLNKLVFPAIWLALIIGVAGSAIVRTGHISIASGFRFIAVAFVAGTAFVLWLSMRLQRVGYAGKELVISNYWREARIPFEQVAAVEPVWWYRGRMVRVRFRSETPFGLVVYYLPKWGFIRCLVSSPDKELRDLIF